MWTLMKSVVFVIVCAVDVMTDKNYSEGYTKEITNNTHESEHGPSSYLQTSQHSIGRTESVSPLPQEHSFNDSINFIRTPPEAASYHDTEREWLYIEQYEDLQPDETKLFIETFKGELHRQVIAKQLSSCPYTPLCTYSLNVTISDINFGPCCARCICRSNCSFYNECCPDIIPYMPSDTKGTVVSSCIPLHLNMKGQFSIYGHNTHAISQCKVDTGYIHTAKCTHDYKTSSLRMRDIVPVFHNKSGTVYRNIHCALCNNVEKNTLEFFKPKLGCTQNVPTRFMSESDLIEAVRISFDCDIDFKHDLFTPDNCGLSISTCNETGLWDSYNADYVTACASYSSMFRSNYKLFRNVFCAMCNGYPTDTQRCRVAYYDGSAAMPYSFSGLLNFDTGEEYQTKANCTQGYIYHKYEDVCIPASCSPTRTLSKNRCVKVVEKVTSFRYSAALQLTPSKNFSLEYAYGIADLVAIGLNQYMESHLAHNSSLFHICVTDALLMADRHCDQQLETDIYASKFVSYLVRLEFIIRSEHDPENTLSGLVNATFDLRHGTSTANETITVTVVNRYQEDFEIGNYLLAIGETDAWNLQFCSLDNKTLIPIYPLPIELEDFEQCFIMSGDATPIASLLNCPLVQINQSTYPWVLNSDGVYFPDKYKIFTHEEFYLLEDANTTLLYLCSEQFFTLTKTTDIVNWTFTTELVVSSACVSLSIVCLFLTLIVFCLLKPLQTLPGKNNMSLVGSLLIAQLLYLVGSFSSLGKGTVACKVVGVLTHYSWLLVVFWMNICTFHMFRVLTRTKAMGHMSGNKRFMLYHIYCGGFSTIFLAINIVSSLVNSDFSDIGYGLVTCYISSKEMTIYTLGIPVAIIIVANIFMFLFVVITIRRSSGVQKNMKNARNDIAIFARLSTLTGATWVFGFVYMWSQLRVFSYVFVVLNAGQGVFIFLSFICTSRVSKMIKQKLTSPSYTRTSSVGRTTRTHVSDK